MPKAPRLSHHARFRFRTRFDMPEKELKHVFRRSILIPYRYAHDAWATYPTPRRYNNVRYRVSASAVLICRGNAIVTVWPLHAEELATVIVWTLLGHWLI